MSDNETGAAEIKSGKELRQEEFINEYLSNGGYKSTAAKAIGVHYDTIKSWFREDKQFKERLSEAEETFYEDLKRIAVSRAKEKSDTLMIFLLKALRPEVYDDNIRKLNYMKDNDVSDAPEIQLIIMGDDEANSQGKTLGESSNNGHKEH